MILLLFLFLIISITFINLYSKKFKYEYFDVNEDNIQLNSVTTNDIELTKYYNNPINVNVSYNIEERPFNPNCTTYESNSNLSTISNNVMTFGYGDMTTLGSAPFKSCPIIKSIPIQPIKNEPLSSRL